MSASVLEGVLLGWSLVFAGLVAFFGLIWVRRREQLEFLLIAGVAAAAAVHCAGAGLFFDLKAEPGWQRRWELYAALILAGSIAMSPLLVHFGLRAAGLAKRPLVVTCYALGGFYLAVLLGGGWWQGPPDELMATTLWGIQVPAVRARPTAVAMSFYALSIGVVSALCALVGYGLSRGARDLLSTFAASIVLAMLGFNSIYLSLTDRPLSISTAPPGYLLFAFGVSITLVTRYTRLSERLEQNTAELEKSAVELRRSYDALQRAQGELVKREQLAVVGELAAVIAHEVRNPLAVIINAVAGLRRSTTRDEDRGTLLGIINEESYRLNRLVGDLLRYARPVSPQWQMTSLPEFVERAVGLQLASFPRVEQKFSSDPGLPALAIDPSLMRQVLDNLIGNAVQAMHEEGTLSIRVRRAEQEGEPGVVVELQDDGEGMDTQIRTRATTPFFTTRPSGTGLGLAIVDRIIEAHEGSMQLESSPGQGTTVTLFLPEKTRMTAPPSAPAPGAPRGAGGRGPG